MHGVKRDRQQLSAELKAQRKEREAKKLALYKSVEDQFFAYKREHVVSVEALQLTAHLLRINPELYTAWNYRRTILSSLFDAVEEDAGEAAASVQKVENDIFASARIDAPHPGQASEEGIPAMDKKGQRMKGLLDEDLELTIEVLKIHPKVYWIWNHRKWCLQQLPSHDAEGTAKWVTEIQMVNKMLDMDARNFHGWNYRRFILTQLAVPKTMRSLPLPPFPSSLCASLEEPLKSLQLAMAEDELRYTLAKIESNFSNFSAWHHRSLLLVPIWTAKGLDEEQKRKERDDEFELVRQAMFVDPDDQSVWTYHSWLLGLDASPDVLSREIASVRELLELEPNSKWCMVSLAQSLSLLQKVGQDAVQSKDHAREAAGLLERLIGVDPDRKQRYQEIIGLTEDGHQ